jgi:quercetin dioxygenase-like cupin family protein
MSSARAGVHWIVPNPEYHADLMTRSPRFWRVYSGADGQSHVAELSLAMTPFVDVEGAHGESSPLQPASGVVFRVAPAGYVLDWHCAPRRQYSISLSGTAEIQVGEGTVFRIEPGDVVLAEDLTGRGHVTRVVGDQPRVYAIVPLTD